MEARCKRHHSVNDLAVSRCELKRFGVLCTENSQQIVSAYVGYGNNDNARYKRHQHSVSDTCGNLFGLTLAERHTEVGSCAVTEKQGRTPAHNRDRKDDSCCGVACRSDYISDENLIYNVVKT